MINVLYRFYKQLAMSTVIPSYCQLMDMTIQHILPNNLKAIKFKCDFQFFPKFYHVHLFWKKLTMQTECHEGKTIRVKDLYSS